MFRTKEKALPQAVLRAVPARLVEEETGGILLGIDAHWWPDKLSNGHVAVIGASGSGKTQTLKAIAYELTKQVDLRLVVIDFHGDQQLAGEVVYPLHMQSQCGINPLVLNLDPEGGGPKIQAISVAANLRKNLQIGPNQEGLIIQVLGEVYERFGINHNPVTWRQELPTFENFQKALEQRQQGGCKESEKLLLKLAATFAYGVFNREAVDLSPALVRLDLSKLPTTVGAIAAEALSKQLMDSHRLLGEAAVPRTYLFIDEAKELSKSPALDRVVCDGRKYGLNLVLASQSERHLSADVLSNTATKIVLPVDQVEVEKVAKKFRFSAEKVAKLQPLQALCRFGTEARLTNIIPYYGRVADEN
jgi:type IV secretory pathway VirB4 component